MSATPQSGDSTLRWVFLGLALIVLIIIINSGINSCKRNNSESDKTSTGNTAPTNTGQEATVLMFDGQTTCYPSIDYKFELDTQGDPIYLKFPGVTQPVFYSGKGTIKVPPRNSGPVTITSANPNREARVRIWKVVQI